MADTFDAAEWAFPAGVGEEVSYGDDYRAADWKPSESGLSETLSKPVNSPVWGGLEGFTQTLTGAINTAVGAYRTINDARVAVASQSAQRDTQLRQIKTTQGISNLVPLMAVGAIAFLIFKAVK